MDPNKKCNRSWRLDETIRNLPCSKLEKKPPPKRPWCVCER